MLDLGQPMHAYDLDKIEGPIVVRRANEGEKLTTLDGKDHDLSVEDLLITDSPNGERGSRVLGIAGVMGGATTECDAATTDIVIEAAAFDPSIFCEVPNEECAAYRKTNPDLTQ